MIAWARVALSLAAGLLLGCPALAHAQVWQALTSSRQLRDTLEHRVHVRYSAGRLTIAPTDEPVLYALELTYDESSSEPRLWYDASLRSMSVELHLNQVRLRNPGNESNPEELRLRLSQRVPMALEIEAGAARSTVSLGTLAIRELRLSSGASESLVSFDVPNRTRMRRLDAQVGAAELTLRGLGNAAVPDVRLRGGVGTVLLDFSGTWRHEDVDLHLELALGSARVTVPADVGIRVQMSRFLAGFWHPGLVRRGGAFYSGNWDTAPRRLRIRAGTALSGLTIERATP